ncbi:MAG: cytochrome P450, partial [Hyphomicrobiales bacterium]
MVNDAVREAINVKARAMGVPAKAPARKSAFRSHVPRHPPRAITPFRVLHLARENVIAVWRPEAFYAPFLAEKFLFRWMYVANNPDAVRHVMVSNVGNYWKSGAMQKALKPLVGNGSFVSNGEIWARQRRINIPAFHHSRIRIYTRYMAEEAATLVRSWADLGSGAEVALDAEMANVTARVVCRSMFSEDLGERGRPVFRAFSEYQEALRQIDYAEMLVLPRWLSQRLRARQRAACKVIDDVIYSIIDQRLSEGQDDRGDFLSTLLAARDEGTGTGLTREQLRVEMSVIFLAGHETTAITLCWALYLLSQDAEVEARLAEEIEKVLAGRIPTQDDLKDLVYTNAVVNETLRLYPPVPVFSRQVLGRDEIDGIPIEPGSNMIVSPWLIHRHRLIWDRPSQFIPERFLPGQSRDRSKYAHIPFGAGPRSCIGAAFGEFETMIILASVIQRFRLKLREGFEVTPQARLSLRPSPGLPMKLEPRLRG